jgi:hypothetical protein
MVIQIVGYDILCILRFVSIIPMSDRPSRLQDKAVFLLKEKGMARLAELAEAGITAATISRMVGLRA